MRADCRIHVIVYSEETRSAVENGYYFLDNTSNPRPDWREYWPIRNFLLSEPLDEAAYYGFFSPRFREKTGLDAKSVHRFVAENDGEVDLVTFSPQVDIGAFFQNGFIGSEYADPGSLSTIQAFVDRIGLNVSLRDAVMDSSTTIFSNYFVARPAFWRRWFKICEQLFEIAEYGEASDPLRRELIKATGYEEGVQRKVFLMEGVVSLLLLADPSLKVAQYNPFRFAKSLQLGKFQREAIACDALKIAALNRKFPEYLATHREISQRVLDSVFGRKTSLPKRSELAGPEATNASVLALMPKGTRKVLEIGPADYSLANLYKSEYPNCEWLRGEAGLQDAADDIDICLLLDSFGNLPDPEAFLVKVRPKLGLDGCVVACISNLQHWSVLGRIVLGLPREANEVANLFTRREIVHLFDGAGLRIVQMIACSSPHPAGERYIEQIGQLAQICGGDRSEAESLANMLQFVVVAVPA